MKEMKKKSDCGEENKPVKRQKNRSESKIGNK